jgi:hypothetical protein
MSLIRRKPTKRIRLKEAGEVIGCSARTVRRMIEEKMLRGFQLNPDRATSPYLLYEA